MSMSPSQLTQLGIAASAAVARQRSLGALVMPPDMQSASKSAQNEFWRHQQVALATQRVCSFKDMIQDEYKLVLQHFEALAGPGYQSRATQHTCDVIEGPACQRAPGCEYVRDMYHWMSKAGFGEGYRIHIAKSKFKGETDLRLLGEVQLKQLHDTIVNNARRKLGLGSAANRRKKERGQGARPSADETPGLKATRPPSLPLNGSPPPPAKSRDYILKPRPPLASVPRDNIPF